jgi:hypothetical protein
MTAGVAVAGRGRRSSDGWRTAAGGVCFGMHAREKALWDEIIILEGGWVDLFLTP